MVEAVRMAEAALGSSEYRLGPAAQDSALRGRSIFVSEDVAPGESFTTANLKVIRPGDGLHPKHFAEVLGRVARVSIAAGTPLTWDLVD